MNVLKSTEQYAQIKHFTRFPDVYQTAEGQIEELIMKFQGDMKIENKQKNKVIEFCLEQLVQAERKAERESIAKIDDYRKAEKHLYRAIEA